MKYRFENPHTNELYEIDCSYDELQEFIKEHPELNQVFQVNLGDPVRLGVIKQSSEMKQILKTIKTHHPHNRINSRFSDNISEV